MDVTTMLNAIDMTDVAITALAISEGMPFMKKWKSNGTLHFLFNVLKTVAASRKK